MRKALGLFSLVAVLLVASPRPAAAQVPEIPDPTLNDIARATMTPSGPVIIYNPNICSSIGVLACRFFRAHEYGHVILGHVLGTTFPPVAEMQADCWAAQHAQPIEISAGIQAFLQQGYGGDAMHGTGFQRAQRVQDAATTGNCHW